MRKAKIKVVDQEAKEEAQGLAIETIVETEVAIEEVEAVVIVAETAVEQLLTVAEVQRQVQIVELAQIVPVERDS